MKTSEAGLAFIAREEGTVLHVYIDVVGVPTIGVGHVLLPGESFPNGITKNQALAILAKDIVVAETAINNGVRVPINQHQFDALVSFTFNCGTNAFKTSTLLKKLNAIDYQGAADELLKWTKGGGKDLPVLVGRRKRERALFLTSMPAELVPPVPVEPLPVEPPVTPEPLYDPTPEPNSEPGPIVPVPVESSGNALWRVIMTLINLFFKRGR